jgi:DNA-binding XRE family transcriptional regulator
MSCAVNTRSRIEAWFLIKDLAKELGVTEDTVINRETRGKIPRPKAREALRRVLREI